MNGCIWRSRITIGNGSLTRIQIKSIRTFVGSYRLRENIPHNGLPERYSALLKAGIGASSTELYPRIETSSVKATSVQAFQAVSCKGVVKKWHDWVKSGSPETTQVWATQGRLTNIRALGNKLWFVDIVANQTKIQGVCNLGLYGDDEQESFRQCLHSLQRGDIIQLVGNLYQTRSQEPSIILNEPPRLLSPCLHSLPRKVTDQETIIGKRHVGFLTNSSTSSLIRAKSSITQSIRKFLLEDDHIEVQTPVLADGAGGAMARPFQTKATEFMDRELRLRVAPELWLKRLVVGGFDRVFEIGPSFRNEGIDLTHNPEFMTCEFYRAYTDLQGLITMTEQMFSAAYGSLHQLNLPGLSLLDRDLFTPPYGCIDFISGIEHAIKVKLPDLSKPNASEELKQLVVDLSLPIQATATMTLPQLLDKLSSEYLEPLSQKPIFIINHPACMSPLSKSYMHPSIPKQEVAARAELFVNGREIANMYEEENSPVEQRRKFLQQLHFKNDTTEEIDEAYLEALEWGMPPIGGWGCGIERLTMAMTGANNIRDVLSFGTLRNVVSKHQKS